jgi:hypothetical protein
MGTRSKLLQTGALLVAIVALVLPASGNPLIITPTTDASVLVNTILGANVTLVPASSILIGGANQQGTFTGGTDPGIDILPFNSGIILTNGDARRSPGPNTTETRGTSLGTAGNAGLTAIAGSETYDANVLTFSFIPTDNMISLQFVFASEEYHEFVGRAVTDAIGFFLNGQNIALVPGTNTPVSINSINCYTNSQYYNATPFNTSTSPCTGTPVNTQYDGLAGGLYSMPLFATGQVNAGVVNTITLAIADAGDRFLDSAVFIAADSFTSYAGPTEQVPEPSTLILLGTGLALGALRSSRRTGKQTE